MRLIDTHAHLDFDWFDDVEAVIARAIDAGLERIFCVGISAASSLAVVELARRFDVLAPIVGIHPNDCHNATNEDWATIERLADDPSVIGIGETGMDTYRDHCPVETQEAFFRSHLQLAAAKDLPVVIHCRDAQTQVLAILDEAAAASPTGQLRGVLHCFSGDTAMAQRCVEMGLFISFAGNVTYRNKKFDTLKEAATFVPADRLLIETDCPFLTPEPLRGKVKRNEPKEIAHTASFLAELRGVDVETLADQTTENARRVFLSH